MSTTPQQPPAGTPTTTPDNPDVDLQGTAEPVPVSTTGDNPLFRGGGNNNSK